MLHKITGRRIWGTRLGKGRNIAQLFGIYDATFEIARERIVQQFVTVGGSVRQIRCCGKEVQGSTGIGSVALDSFQWPLKTALLIYRPWCQAWNWHVTLSRCISDSGGTCLTPPKSPLELNQLLCQHRINRHYPTRFPSVPQRHQRGNRLQAP